MNETQEVGIRKRRSGEEVKRLLVEFEASGMRRNEFCRTRGLALSTLRRHLKAHGWAQAKQNRVNRLVAVELSRQQGNGSPATACPLEVVLCSGRRVQVRRGFDSDTLAQVVKVLEGL
jgi:hypothetical protein